jgi:hypothetical protein
MPPPKPDAKRPEYPQQNGHTKTDYREAVSFTERVLPVSRDVDAPLG